MATRPIAHTPYAHWPRDVRQSCFPFLELPAELRNRVYGFAVEDPIEEDKEVAYLTKKELTQRNFAPSRRQYHGLTQVCHLMRKEFGPLYVDSNEVILRADESVEYAEMILDDTLCKPTNGLTAVRMVVNVADLYDDDSIETDLLPIATLMCNHSSSVSIRLAFICKKAPLWSAGEDPWVYVFRNLRENLGDVFGAAGIRSLPHIVRNLTQVKISGEHALRRDRPDYFSTRLELQLKPGFPRVSKNCRDYDDYYSSHFHQIQISPIPELLGASFGRGEDIDMKLELRSHMDDGRFFWIQGNTNGVNVQLNTVLRLGEDLWMD